MVAQRLFATTAGVAAGAMLYYSLSSDIRSRTARLTNSIGSTATHISDPLPLPPASRFAPPSGFAREVKARWNADLTRTVHAIQGIEVGALVEDAAVGVAKGFKRLQELVGSAGEGAVKQAGTTLSDVPVVVGGEPLRVDEVLAKPVRQSR